MIYLSGPYQRREFLVECRNEIVQMAGGDERIVVARWLNKQDDPNAPVTAHTSEENAQFALQDLDDISSCELMICFTEPERSPFSRGGRHVEMGYALGMAVDVVVVGHRENVFCFHPDIAFFPTWEEAKAFVAERVDDILAFHLTARTGWAY